MRDPLLVTLIGNVRRAGPKGCTLGWLVRRMTASSLAIEKALALQIQAGIMTEQNGVYKMREVLP